MASTSKVEARDQDDVTLHCPSSDEFSDNPQANREKLEKDLHTTQAIAYAEGTIKNLICQWRAFRHFSILVNIFDWPAKTHTICLFAQYLTYTFHSAKSVKNYIYGIRKIHVLFGVQPPELRDIEVHITLLGINKKLVNPLKQAQPITPEIMLDMITCLDLTKRTRLDVLVSDCDRLLYLF